MDHPKQKKHRKHKLKRRHKKHYGKQITNGTEGTGGNNSNHAGHHQEDQSESSGSGGKSGNNNSNNQGKQNMNTQSNHFNDERCHGKLGSDDDATDVEQLQTFNINLKFGDVPKNKLGLVVQEFSFECIDKVSDLTFHPTQDQTLPTSSPISTKEAFPTNNARFLEFFNTGMRQRGVTIYFKVKSPIPVMDICHRVFFFLRENHL